MSKSFAVIGGDLALSNGRSYSILSGQDKLLQDLKLWIMERVGTDPATPTFGSRLDGGTYGGQIVLSLVGQPLTEEAVSEAKLQIAELINKYKVYQLEKIQREITKYAETTITPEETISRIKKIEAVVLGDTIAVRVKLLTLANQEFRIVLPILLQA